MFIVRILSIFGEVNGGWSDAFKCAIIWIYFSSKNAPCSIKMRRRSSGGGRWDYRRLLAELFASRMLIKSRRWHFISLPMMTSLTRTSFPRWSTTRCTRFPDLRHGFTWLYISIFKPVAFGLKQDPERHGVEDLSGPGWVMSTCIQSGMIIHRSLTNGSDNCVIVTCIIRCIFARLADTCNNSNSSNINMKNLFLFFQQDNIIRPNPLKEFCGSRI